MDRGDSLIAVIGSGNGSHGGEEGDDLELHVDGWGFGWFV